MSTFASRTLARLKADVVLHAAPFDQAKLREVIEANSHAGSEAMAQAQARLKVLVGADTALDEAMRSSIKALRLAVAEHRLRASPGIASDATAKLAQLEAEADANMRGRMLDQTFELLMDPELLGPESYFRWEVTNHVSAYSVSPDMYGPYFQAMGEALAPALGDAWTRQIASAWRVRVADLLQDLGRASV